MNWDTSGAEQEKSIPVGMESTLGSILEMMAAERNIFAQLTSSLEREITLLSNRILEIEKMISDNEINREKMLERIDQLERNNARMAGFKDDLERNHAELILRLAGPNRLVEAKTREDVIQVINEVVVNLIGCENFGIYECEENPGEYSLIGAFQRNGHPKRIDAEIAYIKQCLDDGGLLVAEPDNFAEAGPLACVPMLALGRPVGVIVLYELLDQKNGLSENDRQILQLLSGLAAMALSLAKKDKRDDVVYLADGLVF